MKELRTVKGRSLFFNSLFVAANLLGVLFLLLSQLPAYASNSYFFLVPGLLLWIVSTIGIIIFKGRLLLSFVARWLMGSLFVISGLIKANDPIGFSYKLEEYFQDGGIAYRLKEWMESPSFSLESWIPHAFWIAVFICIVEIIIGVLLLIGGKIKFTVWVATVMMVFFTFLTWHSVFCDAKAWYTDQDTYHLPSREGYDKLREASTSNRFFEVEKTSDHVILNEQKHPVCLSDCGCFGDAFRDSVGRSLTPMESFFKDIFLVYLLFWIFISQRIIRPNKAKQNIQFLLCSLAFTGLSCVLFDWYFPLLFLLIVFVSALWMLRVGGVFFSNYWGSMLAIALISGVFILYVFYFDPVKDFRPYAIGNQLNAEMNNGKDGVYAHAFVLKNKLTDEVLELSGKEYSLNSDFWNDRKYAFIRMDQTIVQPGYLASITEQFNPVRSVKYIGSAEKKLTPVKEQIQKDPSTSEVSIRNFITQAEQIVLINAPQLIHSDWGGIDKWKKLKNYLDLKGIPCVLLTASSEPTIRAFRFRFAFDVPVFVNDATELKTISRSNPALIYLENGWIKGKFTRIQTPSVERFRKEFGD